MSARLVALACALVALPASARPRLTGGMGVTVWSQSAPVAGVGLGISGRLQAVVAERVRLEAGLLQGEVTTDDRSRAKRSLIFAAIELYQPLTRVSYALVGARLGGAHLVVAETLGVGPSGRLVRDVDAWTPMAMPTLALGLVLAGKFHLELEGGLALDWTDGGLETSPVVVLGVYFRMGR